MTFTYRTRTAGLLAMLLCSVGAQAQTKPEETEVWSPEPTRVTPATATHAPSDAVALFDGANLNEWVSTAVPDKLAPWTVANGVFTVRPGSGNIQTRRQFGDYQLHLEWRIPADIKGTGQDRGNSGLFLASTGADDRGYELQILDCLNNKTYVNGQAASLYKQSIPLVNACAGAGEWQTYDVIWTAPRFAADGSLASPAYVTVLHNGVLVQNHVALRGETVYIGKPSYTKHGRAPIKLQDHRHPVSFRNAWVRELETANQ
jgi:hypothetical protein